MIESEWMEMKRARGLRALVSGFICMGLFGLVLEVKVVKTERIACYQIPLDQKYQAGRVTGEFKNGVVWILIVFDRLELYSHSLTY